MAVIKLRRPDTCRDCGQELPAGSQANYYNKDKVFCEPRCHGKAATNGAAPLSADLWGNVPTVGALLNELDWLTQAAEWAVKHGYGKEGKDGS